MRSFMDAKAMAKSLRHALAERKIEVSHSDCLEIVARQFGLANWNTLSALIEEAGSEDSLAMPEGWTVWGNGDSERYRLGLDPEMSGAALIESRFRRGSDAGPAKGQFATLMQSVAAEAYRGARLQLSASLRTEDADTGTLWLRVDSAGGTVLRFDNMMQRVRDGVLRGNTDWVRRSIILDVPEDAASISYGFFLQGFGRCWARSFQIEPVERDVATTDGRDRHLPRPENLDFAERSRAGG
jgi:hypothetical protein